MNVLLIIADALRRDAVSSEDAPRLRERLSGWYEMPKYFSAAPWTLPACTSLLTGRDAAVHGRFSHTRPLGFDTLTANFGADRVKAAFVNNMALDETSGLSSGFDEYALVRRRYDEVFTRAHEFLDARRADGKPYFLMLHSNLVHDYYLGCGRAYYEKYHVDREDWFSLGSRVIEWGGVSAEQREVARRTYRACATGLDDLVEPLLARVDADTLICFVADHGEGLYPEEERVHHGGRLHDDLLRVPCAFKVPDDAPAAVHEGMRHAQSVPVTTADLIPTLLDIAGCPVPAEIEGRSLASAADLDARRALRAEDRRYLYVSGSHRLNVNAHGKNMSRNARVRNRVFRATVAQDFSVRAVVEYPYKLIVTEFVARNAWLPRVAGRVLRSAHIGDPVVSVSGRTWRGLELFDLEADPDERRNLLQQPGELPPSVAAFVERERQHAPAAEPLAV